VDRRVDKEGRGINAQPHPELAVALGEAWAAERGDSRNLPVPARLGTTIEKE
jgi:hypothetical protein